MTHRADRPPVITLVGAGSQVFAYAMGTDIGQTPALQNAEVRLVDVDERRLHAMERLFRIIDEKTHLGLRLLATTDRRQAFPGSDYVILSVAVQRVARWEQDIALSRKHGMVEAQGECGGPGGLALTLRNIPLVLDIIRDLEQLAPDALLINFSNPMTRVCRAVAKYTRVRCVGLCHGLVGMQRHLSRLLSRAVEVAACGMNHLNWIHAARWKDTGGDAWPEVQRALLADADPTRSYTRELFEIFGRIVTPDDQHISDFLYHWRVGPAGMQPRYHMLPKAFDFYRTFQREWEQKIADCLSGRRNPMADLHGLSGEGAIPIICATRGLTPAYEECAVNIPNGRCIPNLAPEAVVEVPAFVDTRGVTGRAAGPLPLPLRSLIERQMEVAELAVEAAAEGSRTKALQALAIDPLVPDLRAARAYLDDVLATHKDLLPAFA